MINIKDATRLAKHMINYIALPITNCYQTAVRQGFLLIYKNICSWVGYINAVQTSPITIPYLPNNPEKSCRILLENTMYKVF